MKWGGEVGGIQLVPININRRSGYVMSYSKYWWFIRRDCDGNSRYFYTFVDCGDNVNPIWNVPIDFYAVDGLPDTFHWHFANDKNAQCLSHSYP